MEVSVTSFDIREVLRESINYAIMVLEISVFNSAIKLSAEASRSS